MTAQDAFKRAAAESAIDAEVRTGMVLGLGTGSTAAFVLDGLAERLSDGRLATLPACRPPRRPPPDVVSWGYRWSISPTAPSWM